jgi:hypothetical protein
MVHERQAADARRLGFWAGTRAAAPAAPNRAAAAGTDVPARRAASRAHVSPGRSASSAGNRASGRRRRHGVAGAHPSSRALIAGVRVDQRVLCSSDAAETCGLRALRACAAAAAAHRTTGAPRSAASARAARQGASAPYGEEQRRNVDQASPSSGRTTFDEGATGRCVFHCQIVEQQLDPAQTPRSSGCSSPNIGPAGPETATVLSRPGIAVVTDKSDATVDAAPAARAGHGQGAI